MTRQPAQPAGAQAPRKRPGRPPTASPTVAAASRTGVERATLAQLFDVPPTTVDAWRRAGCPRLASGKFQPARVSRWLLGRTEAKQAARSSRSQDGHHWHQAGQRALALMREFRLEQLRGKYLSAEHVNEQWHRRVLCVGRALLALPARLAAKAPSTLTELVERESMDLVRQALHEYARRTAATPTPLQLIEQLHTSVSQDSHVGTSPAAASTTATT